MRLLVCNLTLFCIACAPGRTQPTKIGTPKPGAKSDASSRTQPTSAAKPNPRAALSTAKGPSPCPAQVAGMKCVTVSKGQSRGSDRPKIFFDDNNDAATSRDSVFFVDTKPVTEGDYERCRRAGICPEKKTGARAPDMVPEQPVLGLSRLGAEAYCRGLSKRLPHPDEAFFVGSRGKSDSGNFELYCVASADMRGQIDQSGRLPYSAQLSWVLGRSGALNNAKGKRRKKRGKSRGRVQCRQACRRGVPWISCDPVFADNFGRPPKKMSSGM